MSAPPEPDLIKVTEIFLIPSSFLVAALGTADTNPHRAAASALGLVVSVLWWTCGREALAERKAGAPDGRHTTRTRVMAGLPVLFAAGWALSTVVHLMIWSQPLGRG